MIFLCFPRYESKHKTCYRFIYLHLIPFENKITTFSYDGDLWNIDMEELPFENLSAQHSSAGNNLGNYQGSPFVLGGGNIYPSLDNNQAETLDLTTFKWSRKEDYPFRQRFKFYDNIQD